MEKPHSIPRHRWLTLLAPLALAALFSGLLVYALYAAPLGERVRLDRSSSMRSHEPDIATSTDGEYVAVVWSDSYISTAAGQGSVYLASGTETSGGWPRVQVYPASASAENLAKEPAVAFDPRGAVSSKVHMAWSQHTGSGQTFNIIHQASCDLADLSTCRSVSPATVRNVLGRNVFMPDVAVDDSGLPHVVWVEESGPDTIVRYAKGPTWTPSTISPSSSYTATQPAIAYTNGCLHIVWAGGTTANTFNHIGYQRKGCGDLGPLYFLQGSYSNPKNPRVAAAGNTVYIVWDIDSGSSVDGYDAYYLVYNYSVNSGATWARTPGNPGPNYLDFPGGGSASFTLHPAQHETEAGRTQYASRLRPDVTLEITGSLTIPHLVWSEVLTREGENEYHFDVFHTTYQGSAWLAETNVTNGTKAGFDIHSAAPEVVVGKRGHIHVAYMEETQTGPGLWTWDLALYQGPIVNRTPDLYLPIILVRWP